MPTWNDAEFEQWKNTLSPDTKETIEEHFQTFEDAFQSYKRYSDPNKFFNTFKVWDLS